jgi:hypothetical protein
MGTWLFGSTVYPTDALVWSSGWVVSLAVAGLLLASVAALVLVREKSGAPSLKDRAFDRFDHRLPSAA